ncbi:putative membrane protein YdjX (TVP38/TMEM64 family) [Nocardiopsis mwathae]|uniref:TVP38/TMEM64 family membrane protein n=1 Tax=Nocardiopsis mwathae TaxID=1472723 RepID=A0A7W9YPH2_9ACTN|nr:VTT domain-containing protein [Nocardiopsis mwathae]MBB6174836.1 putative membrane protein YdjX (TVP38/TMEM64 family) [Nocardiopsis mwathae]
MVRSGMGERGSSAMTTRPGVRAAAFAAFLAAAVVIGLHDPDLAVLTEWIDAAGAAAPLLYLVGYVAAALVFVPRPLLNAMAGVLFPAWLGVVVALAGGVVAASAQFALARLLAADAIAARLPPTVVARLDRLIDRNGLLAVVQLRLLPVVPFAAVNYGFGLTGIGSAVFVLGTALGSLPATVALVLLGDTATDPLSPGFLICVVLFAVLLVASRVVGRVADGPRRNSPDQQAVEGERPQPGGKGDKAP